MNTFGNLELKIKSSIGCDAMRWDSHGPKNCKACNYCKLAFARQTSTLTTKTMKTTQSVYDQVSESHRLEQVELHHSVNPPRERQTGQNDGNRTAQRLASKAPEVVPRRIPAVERCHPHHPLSQVMWELCACPVPAVHADLDLVQHGTGAGHRKLLFAQHMRHGEEGAAYVRAWSAQDLRSRAQSQLTRLQCSTCRSRRWRECTADLGLECGGG